MSYPYIVSDSFARIKAAISFKKPGVVIKRSKFMLSILKFLLNEGYINGFKIINSEYIYVILKYSSGSSIIRTLKVISTPGRRLYLSLNRLNQFMTNRKYLGEHYVVSTSKGI